MTDIIVLGAGPAGVTAALRAADLGARVTLVTSAEFGGMAANDGPIPVRTLAHAARLVREARQFGDYGIAVTEPMVDYPRLLARVRDVVADVRAHSSLRRQIDELGVTVHEHAGPVRFVDPHTLTSASSQLRISADKIIVCTGSAGRRLRLPGFELTHTHSDAWRLPEVPPSMLVIGGGATGVQVASIFNAFGTRVQLFERGPRILQSEDEDVAEVVATEFRRAGIHVREGFGAIDSFEKTADGIRMRFSKDGKRETAEAALAIVALGSVANVHELDLRAAGVALDERGFVEVDRYLQTSAPHVLAAGDVTGRMLLAPPAIQQGFIAATNAVQGPRLMVPDNVNTSASFTEPEYAQTGLTEEQARSSRDVLTSSIPFDSTIRTIIDGRKIGFCKLVVDRKTAQIVGCHVVGERAAEIAQVAAFAIAAGMRVDDLARVPLAFPTYTGNLAYAAAAAARQLALDVDVRSSNLESIQPRTR